MIRIIKNIISYVRKRSFAQFLKGYESKLFEFYIVRIILDSREQELYDWLYKNCSSYQISYYNRIDHSLNIAFAFPEDAMMCKLMWGGK
jgi:hypothetical protein